MTTIPERIYQLAQENPQREILRFVYTDQDDIVLSRRAFFQAAMEASEKLAGIGVSEGDLVIIVQKDSLLLAASFFGASLLGAIPSILPFASEKLHPDRYRAAMSALVGLSHPRVLVTEAAIEEQVLSLLPEKSEDISLPAVFLLRSDDVLNSSREPALPRTYSPEQVALLQHSSGTTGLQKGVALAHQAIFDQLNYYASALQSTSDDVTVSWLPLYHDMGLIAGFLMPILLGGRLVLMSPLDWVRAPYMLMQKITEHGGTLSWLPNFAYNFCAQKIRDEHLADVDLSTMRAFVNCSEPIYAESHRMFAERFKPYGITEATLTTCYAMAETVFAVSQSQLGHPARVEAVDRTSLRSERVARPIDPASDNVELVVSSGHPIEGMAVRVLSDNRTDLPERSVGEIAVRSNYMLTGYHLRPDATEAAFHEGWYLTGDMGYVADGEVFVLGRKKDLIIVGGRNVYPRDLEMLVSTIEGVHPGRVVAFGIPNPDRGTEEVVVIAEIDDENGLKSRIAADIRRTVASGSDVAVRYVELVPRGWLVKTSSGKVSRSANREKFFDLLKTR